MTIAPTTPTRTWSVLRWRGSARRQRRLLPPAQPLHEALAVGLGADAFDHQMASPPEWR